MNWIWKITRRDNNVTVSYPCLRRSSTITPRYWNISSKLLFFLGFTQTWLVLRRKKCENNFSKNFLFIIEVASFSEKSFCRFSSPLKTFRLLQTVPPTIVNSRHKKERKLDNIFYHRQILANSGWEKWKIFVYLIKWKIFHSSVNVSTTKNPKQEKNGAKNSL